MQAPEFSSQPHSKLKDQNKGTDQCLKATTLQTTITSKQTARASNQAGTNQPLSLRWEKVEPSSPPPRSLAGKRRFPHAVTGTSLFCPQRGNRRTELRRHFGNWEKRTSGKGNTCQKQTYLCTSFYFL